MVSGLFIDLLIEKSKELRDAGVVSFKYEDCEVQLAPAIPTPIITAPTTHSKIDHATLQEEQMSMDPMSDPTTFGLNPGDKLPGYQRREEGE